MKTTIGVYSTHEQAIEAVKELKAAGFPIKHVSIIGHHKETLQEQQEESNQITRKAGKGVGIGALVGSTVGVLTGVGVFAVPGLGFLFGAGALVGAIAGLDLGLIGGGVASALSIGLSKDHHDIYNKHLEEGKFLLIVQGPEKDVHRAKEILDKHGTHIALATH